MLESVARSALPELGDRLGWTSRTDLSHVDRAGTGEVVAVPAAHLVAAIPSPNFMSIGPFRLYGIMIALGVLAALSLGRRRWADRGGDPADISAIATWAVPAGLVGARLWHMITDWQQYFGTGGEPLDAVLGIREGGLGIPGGVMLGSLVGWLVVRRRGLPTREVMDAVAPAIPLGQAIGRLGNWFNQELYGRPTSLPWGLDIDLEHRTDRYSAETTFHPTFLYEALWNLGLVALILRLDRSRRIAPGNLLWIYVAGYGIGRLWVEALRIDPAEQLLGLRVNIWTSLGAMGIGGATFIVGQRTHRRRSEPEPAGPPD